MREEINLRDDKQTTLFFDEDITVKQLVTTKGLVIMDDNVASFYYDEFKNDDVKKRIMEKPYYDCIGFLRG